MATTTNSSSTATSATSAFTSGLINISGLGNGTDFNALIDGLVKAEQVTTNRLTAWRKEWTDKVTQFQYLNTQMLSLKTTLEGMDNMDSFMSKSVTSTDSTSLTASADSTALAATHSVIVGQLAQNDIMTTSSGVSSLTSAVATAETSITFSYAGKSYTISNIGAGTTLTGLVNFINNNAIANGKIRATTLFDGSVYHLQLYGMDQGAANQLVLSNTGSLVFGASSFTNTQNAQSALVKVDGYPLGGNWLSRDSNTASDLIPGVTLNFKQADATTAIKIDVSTDPEKIKKNINTFISQVNQVRTLIKNMSKVSTADGKTTGSLLTGNYGVQLISTQLKDICADKGLGFNYYKTTGSTTSGDFYSSLSQLGITTDADEASTTAGMLILDEDKLNKALTERPDEVAKLFAADYVGDSDSQDFSYLAKIDGTTKAGSYEVKIITSAAGISSATINGQPAGIDGWKVTALTGDGAGMVLNLDNHTANQTFTGTVNIKLGKTGEMVEKLKQLTSETDGPLKILEDNYGDITKSIDEKIAREKTRLATLKTNLQNQYARLDALLNTLTQKQNQLTSTIASLTSK